jgi:adenylyltransferase/sulfurtransferase
MTVFIPTPLRPYTGGKDAIEVDAPTIAQALEALTGTNPNLRKHLFTPEGKLRAFVNLYLNDEDVRYLPAKEATAVTAADTLSIIPSIAGGLPPEFAAADAFGAKPPKGLAKAAILKGTGFRPYVEQKQMQRGL